MWYCLKEPDASTGFVTTDYDEFLERRKLASSNVIESTFCHSKYAYNFCGVSSPPKTVSLADLKKAGLAESGTKKVKSAKRKTSRRKFGRAYSSRCRDLRKEYKFYAIAQGWHQRVCTSLKGAYNEINGYSNPILRGFNSMDEAQAYIKAFNEEKEQLIAERDKKYAIRRGVCLGPRTPEAAERQYRKNNRTKRPYARLAT